MSVRRRTAQLISVGALVGAGTLGSAVVAVPAHADGPCSYTVTGDGVAVRESPSLSSVVLKRKNRGEIVNGPCVFTDTGWTAVDTRAAADYIGWMSSVYLRRR